MDLYMLLLKTVTDYHYFCRFELENVYIWNPTCVWSVTENFLLDAEVYWLPWAEGAIATVPGWIICIRKSNQILIKNIINGMLCCCFPQCKNMCLFGTKWHIYFYQYFFCNLYYQLYIVYIVLTLITHILISFSLINTSIF